MGEAWSNQLVQVIILSLPGGFSGLFGYSPAPGPGNLVISITNQAGIDPFGNPYPAGVCVGPASGPQVNITGGNPAAVTFPLNDPAFAISPAMQGGTSAPPPTVNRFGQLLIDGPKLGAGAHDDFAEIQLNSPNADGSSAASVALLYYDANGVQNGYLVADNRGVNIPVCNNLDGLKPGTGTSVSNPGQGDSFNAITLDAVWAQQANYSVPSYRMTAWGDVQLVGACNFNFPSAAGKQLNLATPLPVGYRPGRVHDYRSGDLIGNRCHININTAGVIIATPPSGATVPGVLVAEIDGFITI